MALIHSGSYTNLDGENAMAEPVELTEYEVELRPGVVTTMQLSDEDAERMGVKPAGVEAEKPAKSRAAANKSRTAANK